MGSANPAIRIIPTLSSRPPQIIAASDDLRHGGILLFQFILKRSADGFEGLVES